jgi:hypothetical protein
MKTQLAAIRRNLEALEAFAARYPMSQKLSDACFPRVTEEQCDLDVVAKSDDVRREAGQLFGESGWFRTPPQNWRYHWAKSIGDVTVTLLFVEDVTSAGERTVPTSAFEEVAK